MTRNYKKLERKLGLFSVTNIVIANIVGAGIFTTSGYLMEYLKNPLLMLVLWVIGGVIALCGAIAFGELGATFPEAGGEYIFISKLFHPLPGFLSGWLSIIVGFSSPIAASAIGCSKYLIWAFPKIQTWLNLENVVNTNLFYKILAITFILIFTLIHSKGMEMGAKIQNGLTVLKIIILSGLIVFGFSYGKGSFDVFNQVTFPDFDLSNWKSIGISLMLIMFAYSGWNSATYIGSEIKNPKKIIFRSLLISVSIVVVLYLFLNLFFVFAIPINKMVGEPEIAGIAAKFAFGETAEKIVSVFISFVLFSSLSAFIILGPRVQYSMAKEGYFFDFAAKIHGKYKVPVLAIYLQSGLAMVFVLSGTFEQILIYMGFSLGIFPILAVLGVFKLRREGSSKLKLPGFPLVHLLFIVSGIAMLIFAFLERPVESSIAICTALSGIPVYFLFKRK